MGVSQAIDCKAVAARREENLPVHWHFSPNRIDHIVGRVRGLSAQGPAGIAQEHGNVRGIYAPCYPGGAGAPRGTEGGNAPPIVRVPAAPEKLKPNGPPRNTYTIELRGGTTPLSTNAIWSSVRGRASLTSYSRFRGAGGNKSSQLPVMSILQTEDT